MFVIVYLSYWMIIGVQRGIKHGPEASKQPIMSQSRVSHESVTSDYWGCYYWALFGHKEMKL